MDGTYSPADTEILTHDVALSFMGDVCKFVKENDDYSFGDLVATLIERRYDMTRYEQFFLMLDRLPYPVIVMNYRTNVLEFAEALSDFSIEAVVFFLRNIINAFDNSFIDLRTISLYYPRLIDILEQTKDSLKSHDVWDNEWSSKKELMGVDVFPMWNTDIRFSNTQRGLYCDEIVKMIDKMNYLFNNLVVNDYFKHTPHCDRYDPFAVSTNIELNNAEYKSRYMPQTRKPVETIIVSAFRKYQISNAVVNSQ